MSRIHTLFCCAALLLVSTAPGAQDQHAQDRKEAPPPLGTASFTPPEGNTKQQPLTPENFVTRAAVTNLAEIELSQLALERSADVDIRKYAAQIMKDHQAAQGKLKVVAASEKIALPGTVDEDRRKQKEQLAELTGADFDKRYVAMMHEGHRSAAGLFDSASKSSDLPAALKTYASDTLKTVRAHGAQAEQLHAAD